MEGGDAVANAGRRLTAVWLVLCAAAVAAPVVKNPSFEADRYGKYAGGARRNGGKVTGWRFKGNVGVNPWWSDPAKQRGPNHSFSDNGRFPHGKQVALMQNVCELAQTIDGFEAGKRYVVTYFENARHLNWKAEAPPRIQVTLGGEVIVSLHPVAPVSGRDRRDMPFDLVQSAVFTAPKSGAFDLVFKTTVGTRVTVFVDKVEVRRQK